MSECTSVACYPLRFRGSFRNPTLLETMQGLGVLDIRPVDCVDYQDPAMQIHFGADWRAWLVYGRPLTHAEQAAALSHRVAWERALSDGVGWAVFLEDDVRPHAGLRQALSVLAQEPLPPGPLFINFEPAQQPATFSIHDRARIPEGIRKPLGLTSVSGYTTNARCYAMNRAALRRVCALPRQHQLRPPDFPPAILAAAHAYSRPGSVVGSDTSGESTMGTRMGIPMASRIIRWPMRLSGLTGLVLREHYPSPAAYVRYELISRIEQSPTGQGWIRLIRAIQ